MTGCSSNDDGDGDYMLTFHTYKRQLITEQDKKSHMLFVIGHHTKVYINPRPAISSTYIKKIEKVPVVDGVKLKVSLSRLGFSKWQNFCGSHFNETLIVLLDNKYRGTYKVSKVYPDQTFTLSGIFSEKEADYIIEKVKKNYKL